MITTHDTVVFDHILSDRYALFVTRSDVANVSSGAGKPSLYSRDRNDHVDIEYKRTRRYRGNAFDIRRNEHRRND